MRALVLSIFILGTISLFGQVVRRDLILTQEQNEDWFLHLEQSELKDQVELINRRILSDTNVFVPSNTDRYIAENVNGRILGYCKPIIVAGGTLFYIGNGTKTSDIKRLTELLTIKTIKSIEVIPKEKAIGIYGSRGECRELLVTIKKNSTKKKLAKLEKKIHPPIVIKNIRWRH